MNFVKETIYFVFACILCILMVAIFIYVIADNHFVKFTPINEEIKEEILEHEFSHSNELTQEQIDALQKLEEKESEEDNKN